MVEKILVQRFKYIELFCGTRPKLDATFNTASSCGKEPDRRDTRAVCPRRILRTPRDTWRETRVNTKAKQWAVMRSSSYIVLGQPVA